MSMWRCLGIFRVVRGVKGERMQDKKKSDCKLFWDCSKKGIAKIYSSSTGIKSTLWSKKMSGAMLDSFLTVFTGGLGSEKRQITVFKPK